MPPRKKAPKEARSCACGDNCNEEHSHLPGLLLAGLGIVALPLNFGMVAGVEWARAWPVLLVLAGFVLVAKVAICRNR